MNFPKSIFRFPANWVSPFKKKSGMMSDKDIEEYHNIGRSIKHSEEVYLC